MKAAESSATEPPPQESEVGITPIDYSMPQNEKDKLYVEMLYTIANTVSKFYFRINSVEKCVFILLVSKHSHLFAHTLIKHQSDTFSSNIKTSPRQLILYLLFAFTLRKFPTASKLNKHIIDLGEFKKRN